MGYELWPHQARAIREVSESSCRRVLLVAPTGAGKTTIATELIKRHRGHAVFLVHRIELIDQAHKRLQQAGIDAGVIRATDKRTDLSKPVQVCSVQTLARRKTKPGAGLVVIDEAHHASAKTYRDLLRHYITAKIVGITATPWRFDGQTGLGEDFDELIVAATYDELIDEGLLMRPRLFSLPLELDLSGVKMRGGDYDLEQLSAHYEDTKQTADIVKTWREKADSRPTVAFCTTVAHAHALAARFAREGIEAAVVSAETPERERALTVARWKRGELTVVCNVMVFTEGFDFPGLECAILARPSANLGLFMQLAGRVLRVAEGKERPIILDHGGLYALHGMPTSSRAYVLSDDRETTERKQGVEKRPQERVCPQCFLAVPPGVRLCPECGEELAVGVVPMEESEAIQLVEVPDPPPLQCKDCGRKMSARRARTGFTTYAYCYRCDATTFGTDAQTAAAAPLDAQRAEYMRLAAIGIKHGYKRGWAAHKFKDLFKKWPAGVWVHAAHREG